MKIKAKKVVLPYTLQEVSKFFEYNQERLELQLAYLAEAGELHSHDIKKTKSGDYRLSGFAVNVLVFENDKTPTNLRKLADFVEKEERGQSKKYDHSILLCHSRLLRLRMRRDQLEAEAKGNEKITTEHNRMLDEIFSSADLCITSNN